MKNETPSVPAEALAQWESATTRSQKVYAGTALAWVVRDMISKELMAKPAKAKAKKEPAPTSKELTGASLSAAMARICGVVEAKGVPIIQNVGLSCKDGRLTLWASDLDMTWNETINAAEQPDFTTTVNANALAKAVKGTKGLVSLSCSEGGSKMTVDAGGLETVLPTRPASDMPTMDFAATHAAKGAAPGFIRSLAFVADNISTEETRYYLNGAYIHARQSTDHGGELLTMTATDGHRMAVDDVQGIVWPAALPGVILPRKAVLWLVKNLKAETGAIRYSVGKVGNTINAVEIKTPTGRLVAKVIDGSFPDYNRVLPDPKNTETAVDISNVPIAIETLRRMAALSKERSKAIKISMADDVVTVTMKTIDGETVKAEIPGATYSGEPVDIGINAGYMLDALAKATGAVTLGIQSENSPLLIMDGDDNRVGILMPLRV
jgi:DNA polymerase-3 subunit beta